MKRPYMKPSVSREERAFLSAAFDPNAGALETWQSKYGVTKRTTKAARGRQSNARRGLAVEGGFSGQGVSALLRAEGYTVVRSHMSQGAADVVGLRARADVVGPPVRAVQAKRLRAFKASGLNDAVARFLGHGRYFRGFPIADGTREAWLWVDGAGWCARAVIQPDGTWCVLGVRAGEVTTSITRHLALDRSQGSAGKTLRERLGIQ